MGILNITPDSFSDGGKYFNLKSAVARGRRLVEEGADIIDIGGESTRPFSEPVSAEEEIRRVVPVIENLAKHIPVPVSIDTTKAMVAERAIEAGASMINDISALRLDDRMGNVAAKYEVPVILMHMLETPKTMQVSPVYDDPVKEIKEFLENAINRAESKGIPKSKIIIDPGVGFGKTVEHNLILIKHLREFLSLNVPVLLGPSRKKFIRTILEDGTGREVKPDLPEVETCTHAAIACAVLNGAHIVRVHDVAGTRATVKIVDAVKNVA
ncbi:MAG: dihydropteroate synthase [Deltaproteobacteria bacterium]|nr:dihydropteroate synthase [Deltaproteobacteria bacterium]